MVLNNATKIGLMVMAAAALLLVITVKAGNFTMKKDGYRITTLFNEIDGVSKNSPVMFNGFEIGVVEKIQVREEPDRTVMALTLWLNSTAKLKEGSTALIKNLGFMGEKYVALTAGDPHAAYLAPGATIQGKDPVDFNKLMNDGHELLSKAKEIADNVDERLKVNQKNIDQTMSNLNSATASFVSLGQRLDKLVAGNADNVNGILTRVSSMTIHLEGASTNLEEMSADLKLNPWKLFFRGKEKTEPRAK
ncbi:MAG: MCE family protein [Candidatus Omnitrophica bacterium]|nr:MCE family protein [Candidatus Omnitrophota bacterium]